MCALTPSLLCLTNHFFKDPCTWPPQKRDQQQHDQQGVSTPCAHCARVIVPQERERGLNKRSLSRCIAAAIQAAKYLYHEQSRVGGRVGVWGRTGQVKAGWVGGWVGGLCMVYVCASHP